MSESPTRRLGETEASRMAGCLGRLSQLLVRRFMTLLIAADLKPESAGNEGKGFTRFGLPGRRLV